MSALLYALILHSVVSKLNMNGTASTKSRNNNLTQKCCNNGLRPKFSLDTKKNHTDSELGQN